MEIDYLTRDGNFNSHARVGRDGTEQQSNYNMSHFNSHARVGRDNSFLSEYYGIQMISTHTPV